jgi:hypothetical protein
MASNKNQAVVVLFWQLEPVRPHSRTWCIYVIDTEGKLAQGVILRPSFFCPFRMMGTTWRPQEAATMINQFEYGPPTLLQDCLNSRIKLFEGTIKNTVSLAWIFHTLTHVSWHLGTLVLLSSFGMLNRKYASTVLITAVDLFRLCTFLLFTRKARNASLYQRLGR